MKTLGDTFQIAHGARDEHDQKLEPEEQPVRRVIESTASAEGALPEQIEQQTGRDLSIPLKVTSESTALEAAEVLAFQCHRCVNWRQDEFRRDRNVLLSTAEGRADLDRMRAQAIDCGADVVLSEAEKNSADPILDACMGKCMALSEMAREGVYAHFAATCPSNAPDGSPLPFLFKARDERAVKQITDRVLRAAQGR